MSNKYPQGKFYPKSQGNTESRSETTLKKPVQKTTQTRKNTVESPKSAQFFSAESSRLTDFSTPVYNMRVTID